MKIKAYVESLKNVSATCAYDPNDLYGDLDLLQVHLFQHNPNRVKNLQGMT